jgi:hypothetical protein
VQESELMYALGKLVILKKHIEEQNKLCVKFFSSKFPAQKEAMKIPLHVLGFRYFFGSNPFN